MTSERFWKGLGGRKMGNGYLALIVLTAMSFPLHATFGEYAMGVLGCLGLTSAAVAYEDRKGAKAFPTRRAADRPTESVPHEWASGQSDAGIL